MEKGIVIKIDSKKSFVLSNNETYECDVKGSVIKDQKIFVGDKVKFELHDAKEKKGIIVSIEPKRTMLHRPKIVNVDQVIIITAAKEPNLATYILNKYIAMLEVNHIKPILIFTKIDLLKDADQDILSKIKDYEKMDYLVFKISNREKMLVQFKKLEKALENKISVFTGQTGAGKSTTLNHFLKLEEQIKTQEISQALNRGKHTTTATQLYSLNKNILIADTPGFSSFDLREIEIEDLLYNLKFLKPYLNKCRFRNCIHYSETNCAVKEAVTSKKIPQFIYDDYCKMIDELKIRKEKY